MAFCCEYSLAVGVFFLQIIHLELSLIALEFVKYLNRRYTVSTEWWLLERLNVFFKKVASIYIQSGLFDSAALINDFF